MTKFSQRPITGSTGPDDAPRADGTGVSAADTRWQERKQVRVLSPVARLADVVAGVIVTLSVVGAVSVVTAGPGDARLVLAAGAGAATAWGLVTATLYLVSAVIERQRGRALLAAVRRETAPERARAVIAESLPPIVAASIRPSELEHVRRQLVGMHELHWSGLARADYLSAATVFLLVVAASVAVLLPFLLPVASPTALLLSSLVALGALFVAGYRLGLRVSARPVALGAAMLMIGAILVALVKVLHG